MLFRSSINNIHALEAPLYSDYLGLAGRVDCIGEYNGELAIIDFKTSAKEKKEEWIEDYKLQLMAYIMAHNEVYKTDIKEGHVFLCTRDLKYQQFDLWPADFNKYQDLWLSKVEDYYTNYHGK